MCLQDAPSAIYTAVKAPALEEPDPLQQEVDPKRLVSSRSRGPPRYQHNPTHMPAGGRVNVHHVACAWCELAACVDTHSVQKPSASQPLPLVMERAGDKRARSASPSTNPSQRQTRSKHRILR